ncbi:mercuric ion transport protein [Nicoletella semolina]|uniref:Mercuric ion transport protein n=1 Tax=Nicoletella semolina TaxID=271160 RepID=A0A4R2N7M8_9PAST|nr:hypothetical protein [Nicoletella semolina]MDH2924595.1 hypothetical protein [Nicoletella semolina]TCP16960.1 mercuric ion transport protein [Nicoletella semolina]
MNSVQKQSNKSFFVAMFTLVAEALGSTACCIAPLIYLLFGFSSPWLVSLSMNIYKYHCYQYISRQTLKILYMITFVVILFFLSYPIVLP